MKETLLKSKPLILEISGTILFFLGFFRLITKWVDTFQFKYSQQVKSSFPYIKKRSSRSFQILMYHGINGAPTPYLPTMPVKAFENQIEYMACYCQVMGLDEAVTRLNSRDLPDRAVVLTFDDGYKDMYLNAFPILKRYGLVATCFLPTDVIGSGRILWHDKACWAISQSSKIQLSGYGSLEGYSLTNDQDKHHAKERILWYLRTLEDQQRSEELQRLFEELDVDSEPSAAQLMLNWDEVKTMYRDGIRFGSHTVTHPILSRIPIMRVLQEIRDSRDVIQHHLHCRVEAFAYPSGRSQDFTPEIKRLVQEEGFDCAVSTIQGVNTASADPYALKRLGYWDKALGSFGMRFEYYRLKT